MSTKRIHPGIDLKEVGARIALARNAKGLSIQQLADRLCMTKGSVGHWETGTNAIKAPELARICKLLDVSADELLFGIRRWPFTGVDFDLVNDLDPRDLGRLEGALLTLAEQFGMQIKRVGT